MNYYPSQTSVDKGFFSACFRDRWFLPAVQKFWSRDNIFAALRLAKHESRDVILVVPAVAKSGLSVSCFSRLCQSPEEGKMSFVQFKVFYGDNFERCKMHRMKKERFELITYQEFACEVLKTIGAFLEGKTPKDVRIQYRDDEDTFVNLSCDEDLIDACRCLRPVDNSEDLYRLSVRVHATATPVQAANVRTERTIVNEPANRRSASPAPRKQLHFKEQSTTAKTTKYMSPLQVFLQEKQKAVDNQRRRVSQLRLNLVGKESLLTGGSATSTGSSRKPVCGNCHMEGHNRLNCEFGQCLSVEYCNLLDKHPDEKKEMASIKRQLKSEEKKLEQLEEELTAKAATASSVQNRFSYKMRASLIDSCPEKYLSTTTDGRTVENWHAINRDSKRLEKICRGKVPESSDLRHLLSEEVDLGTETSEPARMSTSVRNPYKRLWQERGVRWPSATSTASSSISSPCFNQSTASPTPYFSQSPVVGCPQKEHTVDAFYRQQDDFVLNLAIKESLKSQCADLHTQYEEPSANWLQMLQGEEKIPPNIPEYSGEVCKENQSSGLALLVDAVNMINE